MNRTKVGVNLQTVAMQSAVEVIADAGQE